LFLFFSLDQLLPCWRGEANELAMCEHQVTYWGTATAAWPRTAFFSLPVTHFASDLRERKRNREVGVDFPVPVKWASSYSITEETNRCFLQSKRSLQIPFLHPTIPAIFLWKSFDPNEA
jgi:hypothetical protein